MDRLRQDTALASKYIIWRRPYAHTTSIGTTLITGYIAYVGGAIIDEWGRKPIWIVWDDVTYMLQYDETDIPEKLNMMASKHSLEVMCGIEAYVFDSEQERLIGLLKLMEQYGS